MGWQPRMAASSNPDSLPKAGIKAHFLTEPDILVKMLGRGVSFRIRQPPTFSHTIRLEKLRLPEPAPEPTRTAERLRTCNIHGYGKILLVSLILAVFGEGRAKIWGELRARPEMKWNTRLGARPWGLSWSKKAVFRRPISLPHTSKLSYNYQNYDHNGQLF